jgi:glycosyltransferase involved in cell wall biosynthesis
MQQESKNAEIVVVGHVTEVYGPVQALENYLKEKKADFLFITVPFAYCSVERASAQRYIAGEKVGESGGPRNPIVKKLYGVYYVRGAFFTLLQVMKRGRTKGVYVGIDNLNAFLGLLLKKAGFVDKVVYYVIDYTKKRFLLGMFNRLYHAIDRICVKHADYVWNISSRIAVVRESQGVPASKNLIVPVGVELEKIARCGDPDRNKHILVAVSHLTESKGVQLIIEVLAETKKVLPDMQIHIIGTGPYESALRELAKVKKVEQDVRFLGPMAHDELFRYLPRCGVALATYTENPNNITYYADPTKPKEYLACGLPVIITRVPWIAELIEKTPMGIAINYDREDLKKAIVRLMTDDSFHNACRANALRYAAQLSWGDIYDRACRMSGIAI